MKPFYITVILEETAWIPFVYCLFRWNVSKPTYIPLFLYFLTKGATETWGVYLAFAKHNNAPAYNLQYLAEPVLLTWQLYNLKAFKHAKKLVAGLQIFWVLLWLTDILLIGSFNQFNILHHSLYSFILLFVTTGLLSKLTVIVRNNIFYNTAFWISISLTFWFVYNILYELIEYISAHMPSFINTSQKFTITLSAIAAIINFILCWAIKCIPEKRIFRQL